MISLDPVGRAHGHGGLVDDDLVVVDDPADLGGHLVHIGKVARSVRQRRRSHTAEDEQGVLHAFGQIGAEFQPPFGGVAGDQRLQSGFEDMHLAGLELVDDLRVDIDAGHIVAHFRQAGGGHEADVTGSDNADVQN